MAVIGGNWTGDADSVGAIVWGLMSVAGVVALAFAVGLWLAALVAALRVIQSDG